MIIAHGDLIKAHGLKRPHATAAAAKAAAALLADHTEGDITAALNYCQSRPGDWWISRIKTLLKLVEHFDTIRAQQRGGQQHIDNRHTMDPNDPDSRFRASVFENAARASTIGAS